MLENFSKVFFKKRILLITIGLFLLGLGYSSSSVTSQYSSVAWADDDLDLSGDEGDESGDDDGGFLDLADEEGEEAEGGEEGEAAVELPQGYIAHPEFASNPDNPNLDMISEEHWNIPFPKFSLFGLTSREAVWIVAQLHILFASFILGVPLFVVIAEILGWRTGDERYERLARETTKIIAMCYSFTALTGGFFLLLLVVYYPSFTTWMFRGFPTLLTVVYPALFILETVLMYMYYYMWDPLEHRRMKGTHIFIGVTLTLVGLCLMVALNAPASFMLTPPKVEGSLKELATLGEWAWINNFSWHPLNLHRFVGNFTYGGYIVGLIGAFLFLWSKDDKERAYYDWQGYTGNALGLAFMLPLPIMGYIYALECYTYDAAIGMYIMSDRLSMFMLMQAILVGVLFIGSNFYMWLSMKRIEGAEKYLPVMKVGFVLIFICAAIWYTPRHFFATMVMEPGMMPEGMTKQAYMSMVELPGTLTFMALMKAKNSAAIIMLAVSLTNYILYRKAIKVGRIVYGKINPLSQYVLVFLAFSDIWLMSLMGAIRELARMNYHVYKVFKDMTVDAFTPTLAYASVVVTGIVWFFFIMLTLIIWMQLKYSKH